MHFKSGASLDLDAPDAGAAAVKAEGIWLRGGVAGAVTRVDELKPRRPRVEMSGAGHGETPAGE